MFCGGCREGDNIQEHVLDRWTEMPKEMNKQPAEYNTEDCDGKREFCPEPCDTMRECPLPRWVLEGETFKGGKETD